MKIVFFSSDNNLSSGAFRAQINLIKDLEKKGHKITLVLPYHWDGKKLTKQFNIKTKHILAAPWVCPIKNNFKSIFLKIFAPIVNKFASLRAKSFLKKEKFDIAVVNTLWTGYGAEAANKLNIPIVWHLREILEDGQNQKFINPHKSYGLINKASSCIAVSEYVKEYYKDHINSKIIKVIYDGVDANIFYNKNKKLFSDKKIHFLMIGTVNEKKGQHIGLKALNQLSKFDFDLKIVGMCNKNYQNKLLSLCPKIKDKVSFEQPTTHPEKYYQKSDIFLMNSTGEAFGLVIVEAMLGGLVVIINESNAAKEIVYSTENGYFYKQNDWNDLYLKILDVINNKDKAIKISKNAAKRALEKFNKRTNSINIEKIYLSTQSAH